MHKTYYQAFSLQWLLFHIGVVSFLYASVDHSISHIVSFPPAMVDVCHSGSVLSVSSNALNGHLGHGDVQLIDDDGDGHYTEANDCGFPVDCDDTDSAITTCAAIAVGSPHPTYGGLVFEVDGLGGGKLVSCPALQGANFGYIDVQHDIPWTSSTTDGSVNTAALCLVYPNFDPILFSKLKGIEWYLPSIEELALIYKTIHEPGSSPFDDGIYLSSTDVGSSRIRAYYFHPTQAQAIEYSHFGSGAYTLSIRQF